VDFKPQIPYTAKKHPKFSIACNRDGKIYSLKTGKQRKLWKTKHGYMQLAVGRSSYLAHRLVSDCYIPNPLSKPFINHKNGIRHDNRIENLEWATPQENIHHARDVLGVKYAKSGFQNANAKFLETHQIILRNLHEYGFSMIKISKLMGFSMPTIKAHLQKIIRSKNGG